AAAHDDLGRSKATRGLGELLGLLQGVFDPAPRDARGLSEALTKLGDTKSALTKLEGLSKDLNKSEAKAFEGQEEELFAEVQRVRPLLKALSKLDPERLELALSVVRPLVVETLERLRLRGVLTFDDLLSKAAELLERSPAVRRRERARIDQLLVDEFQDTDERQCVLVRALALESTTDEERAPGLFVVGDPKQSIYGWRRADLAAFRQFVDDVVGAGGAVERLSINFRSNQEVLDEVAAVLEPTMVEQPGVQAPFEPLVAFASARRQPRADAPAVEYRLLSRVADEAGALEPKLKSGLATELDADEHARAIASAVATSSADAADYDGGRLGYGDHALLLRSMGDLEVYLEALRRHGVPYAVAKDKSYFRRREIVDAISLVSAIVDPTDLLSLVGWLRSPAVGVPDAAWLPLWRAHFPDHAVKLDRPGGPALEALTAALETAAAELDPGLPGLRAIPDWQASAVQALETLGHLRTSLDRDPAELFVEELRRRTAFELAESRRYLGDFRLANLERFFQRLRSGLEERLGDRRAVLRELRSALRDDRDAQEGRPKE
ncbi:MAG: UvrD-helicase domain-containing protein, partial [Planctomycetota bacterium]